VIIKLKKKKIIALEEKRDALVINAPLDLIKEANWFFIYTHLSYVRSINKTYEVINIFFRPGPVQYSSSGF
jgi:hypothetical protein